MRVLIKFALIVVLCLNATAVVEKITFRSGTNQLAGLLALPERIGKHPVVLFVPGDGPVSKEAFSTPGTNRNDQLHHSVGKWARFLDMGFACFAWDKPGIGESPGDWEKETVFERADQLIAAIDYLTNRTEIDQSLMGLWGISQAGWVMPSVAAEIDEVKFVIAVSCPAQTIVEESAYLIEQQLLKQGVESEKATLARELYIRKWVSLRAGVSFGEATRAAMHNQRQLAGVEQPWLAPFTREDFNMLSTNRNRLESFFYNPLRHLTEINVPVLAMFGGKDTQVNPGTGFEGYKKALTQAGNRNVILKEFKHADHVMAAAKTGSLEEIKARTAFRPIPEYWISIQEFLEQHFPTALGRDRPVAKQKDTRFANMNIRLTFKDRRTLEYELNLENIIRRSLASYTNLFGGLPRKENGNFYDYIDFDIYYGNISGEADPQFVAIDVGPQKVFGYLTWETALIHEIFHLWSAETFRYKDYREQWFNEGATEYYAIKHALRFGVLDRAEAVDVWSRSLSMYLTANGAGSVSLREAGRKDLKRQNYFLVCHGGLLVALILDLEIRHFTQNQRSLDDLMRWLYKNHNRTNKMYGLDDIVVGLQQLTGRDFTPFFSRHVHGSDILPVGKFLSRMELEAIREGKIDEIEATRREILKAVLELP